MLRRVQRATTGGAENVSKRPRSNLKQITNLESTLLETAKYTAPPAWALDNALGEETCRLPRDRTKRASSPPRTYANRSVDTPYR